MVELLTLVKMCLFAKAGVLSRGKPVLLAESVYVLRKLSKIVTWYSLLFSLTTKRHPI